MSQLQPDAGAPLQSSDTSTIGVVDLLIVLAKYKRQIFGFVFVVALVSAGISFVLPNVYKASTKLLPPQQQQSSATALLSQLGGMGGIAASVGGLKNPNDLYIAMLKSRTVSDRLIKKFGLMEAYDSKSPENVRRELAANTIISSGKDGLILIEVEDEGQQRVAALANAYTAELLRLTRVLAVTEASQRRVFFERELEQAKDNLSKAEASLKNALDSRGVISVDADSRAVVETVARLRAQVSAKEIQINSMRAFVTSTHPDFLRAEEELKSLRLELSRLENGRGAPDASAKPADTNVGLENIKVLRDVKYYQMLYELLAKQYEAARLDEAKDPSIIQVLDPAIEPEKKIKPRRAIIVIMSAVLAFIAAFIFAILLELKGRLVISPERRGRWSELRGHLKSSKG